MTLATFNSTSREKAWIVRAARQPAGQCCIEGHHWAAWVFSLHGPSNPAFVKVARALGGRQVTG